MTPQRLDETAMARLLLIALAFSWGLNWPAMKIGLEEFSPWTYRLAGFTVSAVTLAGLVKLQGQSLTVPRGRIWLHIAVSSSLNFVAFGLLTTFAQLTASTSRVAVVTYSFPVWASLLGWLVLGERPSRNALAGLVLCIAGLTVLIYPVLGSTALVGLTLSLACAIMWGFATIYLKLTRLPSDLAITTWQVIFAAFAMAVLVPIFHGPMTFEPISAKVTFAVLFSGIVGTGLASVIWFKLAGRLSAAAASLGTLAVPVIGVVSSALILGERPSVADWIGFALIFAAAASVIFAPREPTPPAAP